MRLLPVRFLAVAALVVGSLTGLIATSTTTTAASAATAAPASTGPYQMRIAANFVYVSHVTDDRCYWGIGLEYPKVPKATGYSFEYWDGYWGTEEYGSATVPVPHQQGMTKGMNYFGITGGGGPTPCGSSDPTEGGRFDKPAKAWVTFAHKPKNGFIEGTVTDRDDSGSSKHKKADSPVKGVEVTAYDGHRHDTAITGPGGIYFMEVKPGHYRVVPDDTSVKKSSFTPTHAEVHVEKNTKSTADFRMKAGLKVVLNLSKSSVAADGMRIVHATLTTTKFGKDAPNENVAFTIEPDDENSALTTAPKVAICGANGRVWPTNEMSDTVNVPVNVTTGAKGVAHFTLAPGTVPGDWSLQAWGKNVDGELSSDSASASDAKKLNIEALKPTTSRAGFVSQLRSLKSQPSTFTSADPSYLATTLAGLAAAGNASGVQLGGLVFSVANSSHGTVLLVSSAADAPRVESDGTVRATGSTANDLVLDPAEWSTVQNGGLSLLDALQAGGVNGLPTAKQWEDGKTVDGWTGTSGLTMTVPNQSAMQQFGWSYGSTCT